MNERTINVTPPWESVVQIYCAILELPADSDAKREARQELLRMGRLIDQLIAERSE